MSQASIYQYNQRAEVLVPTRTGTNYYGPSYNKNLVAYKGLNIDIEFFAKDTDRKPQPLHNKIYTATIIDRISKAVIITKSLQPIDYDNGQLILKLDSSETNTLDTTLYDMIITYKVTGDTGSYAGNSDQNSRIIFTLDVKDGHIQLRDSQSSTTWTPDGTGEFDGARLSGPAQYNSASGLNTGVIHTTTYTGVYKWQASLSLQPLTTDWFDVGTNGTITSGATITSNTFNGMYQWVRLNHTPAAGNVGTLDKVVYRS